MQRQTRSISNTLVTLTTLLCAAPALAETPVETAPLEAEPAPAVLEPFPVAERELPLDTEEVYSGPGDRRALSVTVYQRGPALIVEEREIGLADGANALVVNGLPKTVDPASIAVSSDHDVTLTATHFTTGDLNEDALLAAHLGRTVRIFPPGTTRPREARLLAYDHRHLILALDDGVEAVARTAETRILFDNVPPHLTGAPAIELRLTARRGGVEPVRLGYRSGGLQWRAGYQLHIDRLGLGNLIAYGEVNNRTGIDLPGAEITFVAASLGEGPRLLRAEAETAAAPEAETGDLLGHPTYRPRERVDLWAGRSHRIRLFEADDLEVTHRFRTVGHAGERPDGPRSQAVTRRLEWTTAQPLPAGEVYVHRGGPAQRDVALVGTAPVPATPAGGEVALDTGPAFHLTAVRTLLERGRPEGGGEDTVEATWAIDLRNAGDRTAPIEVVERIPGSWKIIESSHEHEPVDAGAAAWRIDLNPGRTVTLEYTVRWEAS